MSHFLSMVNFRKLQMVNYSDMWPLSRLRFSFCDVKPPPDQKSDLPVKSGRSPILASVFSDVFQVYSAKKFPGVCDSTELSKCFATQGIKIPIRKEGGRGADNDDDDDE